MSKKQFKLRDYVCVYDRYACTVSDVKRIDLLTTDYPGAWMYRLEGESEHLYDGSTFLKVTQTNDGLYWVTPFRSHLQRCKLAGLKQGSPVYVTGAGRVVGNMLYYDAAMHLYIDPKDTDIGWSVEGLRDERNPNFAEDLFLVVGTVAADYSAIEARVLAHMSEDFVAKYASPKERVAANVSVDFATKWLEQAGASSYQIEWYKKYMAAKQDGKQLLIQSARRSGKTTLMQGVRIHEAFEELTVAVTKLSAAMAASFAKGGVLPPSAAATPASAPPNPYLAAPAPMLAQAASAATTKQELKAMVTPSTAVKNILARKEFTHAYGQSNLEDEAKPAEKRSDEEVNVASVLANWRPSN